MGLLTSGTGPWISLRVLFIDWWDWPLDFLLYIIYRLVELVPGFPSVYYLLTRRSLDFLFYIIWDWSLDFPLYIIYRLFSVVHRSGRGREGGKSQVLGQDRA